MKMKIVKIGLIPLLLLASVCLLVPLSSSAGSGTLPNGATYSWEETQYNVEKISAWDGVNERQDFSDDYSYNNTYLDTYDDIPGTYIVRTEDVFTELNVTSSYIITMSGNQTVKVDLNVYRVDVNYGEGVQLIWMAAKDGRVEVDYWITQLDVIGGSTEGRHDVSTINYKRYNSTTDEFIEEWTEHEEDWRITNTQMNHSYPDTIVNYKMDMNFTAPLIIVMQIFTTLNGEKVAWADMFFDYVIYNDSYNDGIYSAGLSENPIYFTELSLHNPASDEWSGTFMPMIAESYKHSNMYNISDPSKNMFYNESAKTVTDKTIEEISTNIEFEAPVAGSGNDISWGINYPDYPITGRFYNQSTERFVEVAPNNALYEHSSPGDFKYDFNFEIFEDRTLFCYTIDIPKISNDTFYNAVQGMSLAMPHYTYFMSSYELEQVTDNGLSKPEDILNVNIDTFPLAEVSFAIPAKRNYTLQDYPNVGTNSSFECKGATVSSLLIESSDTISSNSMFSSLAPFVGVIFTLEENIDGDPVFEDFEKLFFMYTANYPTWSGERLIHDPTFTVYYVSGGGPGFPFLPLLVITIILSIVISVAVPATYRTFTIQKHKNARKTKTTSKIRSESKMGSVKVNNEASDGVGIRSEFEIDSSRFLNILRQENAYELLDKLNLTLTTKDFWKIIEKLELSAEDERQFVQDMLSLTPIERQKMLFNMLKLKDSNNSETFL